ncbi:hypothetical protein ABGB12_12965 [Actinocorallia sp. B10E7]|uniref:hypothetical protein n=1 Tax=Actinocorallia sp. B10E7 TaxID=3153558 RepID=UPI00325EEA63
MSRLSGVLAALPALLLLWYLPSLGELYWWREQTRYGADGDRREIPGFPGPPDWTPHTLVALAACALVLGVCLVVSVRRPVFGFVAGVPLTVAGVYGMLSVDHPRALVEKLGFLSLPGPDVTAEQLRSGTMSHLGQGSCLLAGGALLAAALCGLLPSRRPPLSAPLGALAGLAVMAFAWGCVIEGGTRYTEARPALTALAALLLGCAAGARRLPAVAALACGLPVFALGLTHVLEKGVLTGIVNVVLPRSLDSGEHMLLLRGSVFASAIPMLVMGAALVVAALGRVKDRGRVTSSKRPARPVPAARRGRTGGTGRAARQRQAAR